MDGLCSSEDDEGKTAVCEEEDSACLVRFSFSETDGTATNVARICTFTELDGEHCVFTAAGIWECSCKEDMCNNARNSQKLMEHVTSTTTTTTTTTTSKTALQCHTCSDCSSEDDEGTLEVCWADDNACIIGFQLSADGEASNVWRQCGTRHSGSSDETTCETDGSGWF